MNLSILTTDDQTARVAVQGAVTTSGLSPLEEPLAALLGSDAYHRQVWLDLRDADYLDSSGIGWLLTCHKRMKQAGGKLGLLHPQPLVANILKVMKLDMVFSIEPPLPARGSSGGMR